MRTLTLHAEGMVEPAAVTLARAGNGSAERGVYEIGVGNRSHEVSVEWHTSTGGTMHLHGKVLPFYAAVANHAIHVWLGGKSFVLQKLESRSRRAGAGAGAAVASDRIVAPMPGTILKINVKPGDTFAAHEPLIVMESMKMEMSLSSPAAGRVKAISCQVGALVDLGAVLAKLELKE